MPSEPLIPFSVDAGTCTSCLWPKMTPRKKQLSSSSLGVPGASVTSRLSYLMTPQLPSATLQDCAPQKTPKTKKTKTKKGQEDPCRTGNETDSTRMEPPTMDPIQEESDTGYKDAVSIIVLDKCSDHNTAMEAKCTCKVEVTALTVPSSNQTSLSVKISCSVG